MRNYDASVALPHGCLIAAALFSTLSFASLLIGTPMLLHDMAALHFEMAQQQKVYVEMANNMWDDLMVQGQLIRIIRAKTNPRVRRQSQYNFETMMARDNCPPGPPGMPGEPGQNGANGEPGATGLPGMPNNALAASTAYKLEEAIVGADHQQTSGGDKTATLIGNVPTTLVQNLACGKCPAGPPGPPGYKGNRGPRGEKGAIGEIASPGRDGQIGDEGPEGDIGHSGDVGEPGPRGPPGEDRIGYARGAPGQQGEPGTSGPVGDEGPPGERGDDAPSGSPGEPGPQGPHGAPGKDGFPGAPGPTGAQGADAEYCPCPERSAADDQQQAKKGSGNVVKQTAATSTRTRTAGRLEALHLSSPYANFASPTAADGYPHYYDYSKVVHANALRRRHL